LTSSTLGKISGRTSALITIKDGLFINNLISAAEDV